MTANRRSPSSRVTCALVSCHGRRGSRARTRLRLGHPGQSLNGPVDSAESNVFINLKEFFLIYRLAKGSFSPGHQLPVGGAPVLSPEWTPRHREESLSQTRSPPRALVGNVIAHQWAKQACGYYMCRTTCAGRTRRYTRAPGTAGLGQMYDQCTINVNYVPTLETTGLRSRANV